MSLLLRADIARLGTAQAEGKESRLFLLQGSLAKTPTHGNLLPRCSCR